MKHIILKIALIRDFFDSGLHGRLGVENEVSNDTVLYTSLLPASEFFVGNETALPLTDALFANNLFNIDANSGMVTFKNSVDADAEYPDATNGAFDIRVKVTATHDGIARSATQDVVIQLISSESHGHHDEPSGAPDFWVENPPLDIA